VTSDVVIASSILVAIGLALALYLPLCARLDPRIRRAIAVIFALRVCAVLAVFAMSTSGWQVLHDHVAGPGLWRAFPDAISYHAYGVLQVDAHARGLVFQTADGYPYVVGTLYELGAISPLVPLLFNPITDIVTLTGLVLLMQHVSRRPVRPWIVWAIGLWPSWLGWSTQLLKESILLACCVGALVLVASVFARSADRKALRRYWLLEWPIFMTLVGCLALFRPAAADVLTVAGGVVLAWAVATVIGRRTSLQTAVVALAVAVAVFVGQTFVRRALVSATAEDTVAGYVDLGIAYEREGKLEQAIAAYRTALLADPYNVFAKERLAALQRADPLPFDALAPLAPRAPRRARAPSSTPLVDLAISIVDTFNGFAQRISLPRLHDLRRANLLGATRFAPDANISTIGGALRLLPTGVAHALFGPFPGVIFGTPGTSGTLRRFSLIELPLIIFIVATGAIGSLAALRRGTMVGVFLGSFAALGILALALTVPNDGLLFRYRLPFVAALAVFVPLGVDAAGELAAMGARRRKVGVTTS
jgi:hypothetical protein